MNQSNFVSSPAAEDYAEQFATAYINIPADKNGRDARTQEIQNYLATGLTTDQFEDLSSFNGSRNLTGIHLYKIQDVTKNTAVFQFRVQYNVTNINGNKKANPVSIQSLLSIPIGTDGTNFNVIEQPSFQALPPAAHLAAVTDQSNGIDENYKDSDALKNFAQQFFTAYTQYTMGEMSFLMQNPSTLKGLYQYEGLENFVLYSGKGDQLIIKSLVDLKDINSNLIVKEPVTLDVVNQNGKYFVEQIKFTIGGQ